MPRHNSISDIFRWIDTHDNDTSVCWEWVGALSGRDERGYFTYSGVRRLAYHITYELFEYPNGPIEEGMVHRHSCDNQRCCNPFHIKPGTQSDNEHDKYKRDRAGYPLEIVREISRWAKLGANAATITGHINRKFDLSISVGGVTKVMNGQRRFGDE